MYQKKVLKKVSIRKDYLAFEDVVTILTNKLETAKQRVVEHQGIEKITEL